MSILGDQNTEVLISCFFTDILVIVTNFIRTNKNLVILLTNLELNGST